MSYPYVRQPRPEQLKAMKRIHKVKQALVIGDMGVGKTKIGVDFIANMVWHKKASRAVVVVPLEALDVWMEEITTNCPFLSYSLLLRKETDKVRWDSNVILVNYDFLCPRRKKRKPTARAIKMAAARGKKPKKRHFIDKKILNLVKSYNPQIAIIDEGHRIKKPTARRSKAIHELGNLAEYRIDMTGTPMGNKKVIDLWSQFKFIKSDLLEEDFDSFKYKYGVWGGFGNFTLLKTKNVKSLMQILAPHIIRIKKTGLPEKNFIPFKIPLPEEARDIYKQMNKDFVAYVNGKNVVASIALTKALKLSQISGGFIRDEKKIDHFIHNAKRNALKHLLENLQEQGETRVVVFGRFLYELEQIRQVFVELNWPNIHRVRGRVLQENLNKFNIEGGAMICQTASGSGSNNFQAANYMIFYSTDYSLINHLQAIDRIHRLGQTKICYYYFIQCKGTIDVRIYNLLQENKEISENIKALAEEYAP